jgi:hypothetical protein
VGYARDTSRFGSDGTQMTSDGYSVAAYASYQPTRSTFVDALLGYGTLNFDTRRYVVPVGEFAVADREGSQIFGSIAGGLEWRNDSVLVSPYARLDFAAARFDQATESGVGSHALTYQHQTQNDVQGVLGLRAGRTRHRFRPDAAARALRVPVRLRGQRQRFGQLRRPAGRTKLFGVAPGNAAQRIRRGRRRRFPVPGRPAAGHRLPAVLLGRVEQRPDAAAAARAGLRRQGSPTAAWLSRPLADAVQVEGGFTFDDNVSRGRDADEILSDKIYGLTARTSRTIPIGDNAQAVMTGLLNGEAFHTYTGLAHVSGGAQAELQYRGSAAFDAVTFAAFARGWLDGYESSLRTGGRLTFGVSARRSLTDRIDVHGEVTYNQRRAQSAVWDLNDWSARLSLDWSLGRRGTLYLIGDYRRGDTVADGVASLLNASLAEVFVLDDAFPGDRLFAYRFDGTTWIGTLGYSLPLGPRDAIDVSWRHAQTTPDSRPGFDVPGSLRYVDNQYSIVYVLRF